jgi:alpha-beta hydrolase superfamily lysophospholipase
VELRLHHRAQWTARRGVNAFAKDPAKLAAATAKPLLIVQGEADLQVTVEG